MEEPITPETTSLTKDLIQVFFIYIGMRTINRNELVYAYQLYDPESKTLDSRSPLYYKKALRAGSNIGGIYRFWWHPVKEVVYPDQAATAVTYHGMYHDDHQCLKWSLDHRLAQTQKDMRAQEAKDGRQDFLYDQLEPILKILAKTNPQQQAALISLVVTYLVKYGCYGEYVLKKR